MCRSEPLAGKQVIMSALTYSNFLSNSRLPDDVLFVDEPQIARWDYDNNNWRMDGFTDFNFDEGKQQKK